MTSGTDAGIMAGEQRMFIDGELTGSDGGLFDVEHPASQEVVGQVADGTEADMARAVAAARRAFDDTDWSRDVAFRHHCLIQLHEALDRD